MYGGHYEFWNQDTKVSTATYGVRITNESVQEFRVCKATCGVRTMLIGIKVYTVLTRGLTYSEFLYTFIRNSHPTRDLPYRNS